LDLPPIIGVLSTYDFNGCGAVVKGRDVAYKIAIVSQGLVWYDGMCEGKYLNGIVHLFIYQVIRYNQKHSLKVNVKFGR